MNRILEQAKVNIGFRVETYKPVKPEVTDVSKPLERGRLLMVQPAGELPLILVLPANRTAAKRIESSKPPPKPPSGDPPRPSEPNGPRPAGPGPTGPAGPSGPGRK
jgi:hypothetical protein